MNSLTTFDFNTNSISVVEIGGEPWFVAVDIYRVLGLNRSVIRRLDSDEVTLLRREQLGLTPGRDAAVISESGLYKLIMRSDKPEARSFQDWVTRVVLPAIRKDGGYIAGEERVATGEMGEEELIARALVVAQRKIERLSAENAGKERELKVNSLVTLTTMNVEPRVLDTDLAEALGMANVYDIRTLIRANSEELQVFGNISAQPINSGERGRPGTAFYLNEDQAVHVVGLSRTPKGRELRVQLTKMFNAWRRGERPSVQPALPDFTDPAEAARAWADQYDARLAAEEQVKLLEPAARVRK